ncbi:uncharacterized protein [Typha latifolia]|uniref:uncharacterized protein n=1 Tax=Typha latifolia TaxID=4733 RepID=UPI003C2FF0CC
MSPIIACLKKGDFHWSKAADKAFEEIKKKMTIAPVMRLLDFSKAFEVECDASGIEIGGVLSQECHPIAYFSEKLNEAKKKVGVENKAADALSRRVYLLSAISIKVTGFDKLKEDYTTCSDFGKIVLPLLTDPNLALDSYSLQDGYLFKANKLCVLRTFVRDFLVWDIHAGGLSGHFGRDKTIEKVERQFYWPSLKRDVAKLVGQCRTCQLAKHRK